MNVWKFECQFSSISLAVYFVSSSDFVKHCNAEILNLKVSTHLATVDRFNAVWEVPIWKHPTDRNITISDGAKNIFTETRSRYSLWLTLNSWHHWTDEWCIKTNFRVYSSNNLLQAVASGEGSPWAWQPPDPPMVVAVLSSLERNHRLQQDTVPSIIQ